jgi:hypothetical protein
MSEMAVYSLTFYVESVLQMIATIATLIVVIVMIRNFTKKKTVGTALLGIMYFTFFLSQALSLLYNYWSVAAPETMTHKVLITLYFIVINLPNVFLYFFASRHILRDSDVIKSLYSIMIIGGIFLMTGLFVADLFYMNSETFYVLEFVEKTGFTQYSPTILTSLPVYLPIVLLIQLRIVAKMSHVHLQKKQQDPIKRRGFLYILLSVISLFMSVFMTVIYTFVVRIPNLPAIVFISIYLIRAIFIVGTVVLSYIGWILPTWFRRRIRKKSWASSRIKMGKEPSGRYVTSKTYIKETHIVKENQETN